MEVHMSEKAEKVVTRLVISAMDYGKGASGHVPADALSGCEHAGRLRGGTDAVSRALFLSLMASAGLDSDCDSLELRRICFELILVKAEWFDTLRYIKCESYRHKVNALVDSAIHFHGRPDQKVADTSARMMGISRVAFNKSWASRHSVIRKTLRDWAQAAAMKIK